MGLGSAGIDVTSLPIGASVQTAEAYWEKTSSQMDTNVNQGTEPWPNYAAGAS